MKNLGKDDFPHLWQHYINEPDKIIWVGGPQKRTGKSALDRGFLHYFVHFPLEVFSFFLVLGILAFLLYLYPLNGYWGLKSGVLFLGVALLFIPDYLNDLSRQQTKYMITKDSILFRLVKNRWSKARVYRIPFDNIAKVSYEQYDDESGVLHFFVKEKVNFKTEEFVSGRLRYHPTFESIADVISVYHLANKAKASYKAPENSNNSISPIEQNERQFSFTGRQVLIYMQTLVAIIFSLYILDFYFLPERSTVDQVVDWSTHGHWYKSRVSEDGAGYLTKKGFRFGTSDFAFHRKQNVDIKLTYSLIFRSVKDVSAEGKSYKDRLLSDLNGLSGFFHFITFFVILGSRVLLDFTPRPKAEFLMKVATSNMFFLGISGHMWYLYG